jgi:hypothetical protein
MGGGSSDLLVGEREVDDAVEPAGTRKRIVEGRRSVGRRHDYHAGVVLKAVHLRQQLVDRVYALVVAGSSAVAALLAQAIELVDEQNAWRL